MNKQQRQPLPPKGTREYHIHMLRKLRAWLKINPKNNPIVADEAEAISFALRELGDE